jgi:glucose-1-phosphate thymidylyltransferase
MKAIILAAGFAKRLYPLTLNKSKCLLEIKGKPILDYIIKKIKEVPEEVEIIVVTNEFFYNDFLQWKNNGNYQNVRLISDGVSSEENKFGAIGDLLFCVESQKIDEDLFLIGGDNIFQYSLKEAYEVFKSENKDLSIFYDVQDINEARRFGIAVVKDNLIVDFEEKPNNPKSTLCSTSTYFFRRETLSLLKKFIEEEKNHDQLGLFLQYLYKKIPLRAHVVQNKWFDIGTNDALQKAKEESW